MKEVTGSYEPGRLEGEIRRFWTENNIYERVKELRQNGEPFFFVDGPPYTTGHIHLGTAWNKILKDSILRYFRMCGKNVIERAGYDMHGLPIEVRVEHELGFSSKKDIEEYGIDRFIRRCREFAETHRDIMSREFKKLGVWLDFDNPYQTIREEYIEAAWWTIQQAHRRGLLEKGFRVVNWCPRCETAIADAEVEYRDRTDPSILVAFPITGREGEGLVIWTTTPWTLPANVAVAVDPDARYARVRAEKEGESRIFIIAEAQVEDVLRRARYTGYEVLETFTGSDLVGISYESPLAHRVPRQREIEHRVVAADFVTLENSGLVHIAPGHGWDDYLLGLEEGLEIFCPVDAGGCFTEEAGAYADMFVRDADQIIMDDLGDALLARGEITHRYGHCWRCKTPIIYRATEQWFLRATAIRDRMLEEIGEVDWYPAWAGSARFHDFVRDARDWCISRQRYWGIPIPIWICPECSRMRVIGTIAELAGAAGKPVPDPHRPYVDELTIPCECGGTMRRVEDIFDVWFDSAVASWATLNFPREKELFERLWPADFITEGQDQTRGWFYSQLGASTVAFDRSPYRSVLMHGFALDAEGRKMSKSLGNVVTPQEVIDAYGVDVLRLYMLSANAPWDDMKFNWDGVKTVNRALNILWNVYRFPLPYMILDGFSPEADGDIWRDGYIADHAGELPDEDRWIISRVNTLSRTITAAMGEYRLHQVTREIINFILEDLSRWYVQIVRPRMWLEEDSPSKRHAYETMYSVLRRLVQLIAPFTPHIAEAIYRNLRLPGDPESVHMLDWFSGDDALMDTALESAMEVIRRFDNAVATARQEGRRKLRWPVASVVVATAEEDVADALTRLNDLARMRANAREVRVVRGRWDRPGWKATPVMRTVGPTFGKDAPVVRGAIGRADAAMLKEALDRDGEAEIEGFRITPEHVEFSEALPDDVKAAPMEGATVYVDLALTPELEGEGYAREIIRRLQEMRRVLDLNVDATVDAAVMIGDGRIAGLLEEWGDLIRGEVRIRNLSLAAGGCIPDPDRYALVRDWDVEGIAVATAISPVEE
ncbi:MAG: isoleucine--tRNA ligase [Methanoculleaceae archaeon]